MLLGFFESGRTGNDFDSGIEMALRRILVSPDFLFRRESDPIDAAPGEAYEIGDLELASRLSFFLWSSLPDDELLSIAERGELRNPAILSAQVRRMLADVRSRALVDNFGGQWLYMRNMNFVTPDTKAFPDFDANLREAMSREMSLFLESQMREDHSVLTLMTADYTFVNERLARHYGIPNIYGNHFRRIQTCFVVFFKCGNVGWWRWRRRSENVFEKPLTTKYWRGAMSIRSHGEKTPFTEQPVSHIKVIR